MLSFPRSVAGRLLLAGLAVPLSGWGLSSLAPNSLAQNSLVQSSVRQVKVIDSRDAVEIEVEASDRIVPQTQMLTGPDRLVVDFPNAVPGSQLRSQSVNRGQVKDVRIGLFQAKPPITRLVLDLKTAQSYQIFPYGRTVMIKVIGAPAADASAGVEDFRQSSTRPGLVNADYTNGAAHIISAPAKPALEVSFRDGLLAIRANKATFSEVLFAVQQRTGADISIPAGAEQERVVADLGPAPAQEVLAQLLNGSNFNFLILNSANDPRQLDRVILTPRSGGGAFVPAPPVQQASVETDDEDPGPPPQPPVAVAPAPRPDLPPQIQPQQSPDENAPNE
jgi:hypothetical protein